MMPVAVTAIYAGILTLISTFLAFQVGGARGRAGVSLGDGGNEALIVAQRRHLNLLEYVPLALILMVIIELNHAPKLWLHVAGIALVIARLSHPMGLSMSRTPNPFRFAGAVLTLIVTLALVAIAIWQGVSLMLIAATN
jgi:uncharacterized protein